MKDITLEKIRRMRYENLLKMGLNQLEGEKIDLAKQSYKKAISLEIDLAEIFFGLLKTWKHNRVVNEILTDIYKELLNYDNYTDFDISLKSNKIISHNKLVEFFINLINLLKPTYFFDIGSYDGSASIRLSRALPTLKAIAFEANINNYSKWKDRKEFQELSIRYEYQAISNYNGIINFNIPTELTGRKLPTNHGGASLMLRADPNAKYLVTEVKCGRLDDFCLDNQISLDEKEQNFALWIDVEGAAKQVLEGCNQCLSKTSLIFIEVEEYKFWQDSAPAKNVISQLISYGFIPIARDYEYPQQYNLLFVNSKYLDLIGVLINEFYLNLKKINSIQAKKGVVNENSLENKIKSVKQDNFDDLVSQKRRSSTQALEIIREAITNKKPFSLIRIGDGEATILGAKRDIEDQHLDAATQLWWKQKIVELNSIEWLRTELIKSINFADMLGIFDPGLDANHSLINRKFLLSGKMVRKYCDLNSIDSFVSADVHLSWHDENLIASLVAQQKIVTLITCRDITSEFADKFNIKTVIWLPIPAEAKYATWQEIGYYHYPVRMHELLKHIQPLFQGHVFLVGAGILGKIYCKLIKERGGIALDLGSVFDNWAAHTTRPSVRNHRIGV